MEIERILRATATITSTIPEEEYEQAKANGTLRSVAISQLHFYLWDYDQALLDEIIQDSKTSYTVLCTKYNRDDQQLLSTIVAERPILES